MFDSFSLIDLKQQLIDIGKLVPRPQHQAPRRQLGSWRMLETEIPFTLMVIRSETDGGIRIQCSGNVPFEHHFAGSRLSGQIFVTVDPDGENVNVDLSYLRRVTNNHPYISDLSDRQTELIGGEVTRKFSEWFNDHLVSINIECQRYAERGVATERAMASYLRDVAQQILSRADEIDNAAVADRDAIKNMFPEYVRRIGCP
jgi:hypothetical protein